jgi:hypothetical protein
VSPLVPDKHTMRLKCIIYISHPNTIKIEDGDARTHYFEKGEVDTEAQESSFHS